LTSDPGANLLINSWDTYYYVHIPPCQIVRLHFLSRQSDGLDVSLDERQFSHQTLGDTYKPTGMILLPVRSVAALQITQGI